MRELFNGQDPKLVLFDLDGTLIDSVPDLAAAVDVMLTELGRPVAGIERVRHWVGNGAQVLVQRALTGEQHPDAETIDPILFDRAFSLFMTAYGNSASHTSTLYPGVMKCLEGLQVRGIKLGVVTNKPIQFTHPLLEEFGIAPFFSVVLGGDSLPQKKPAPEPLLHAMKLMACTPQETLMVGDSKSDIGAARAAGCPVAAVPYGYNHGESISSYNPDLEVEQLDQLL